MCKSRNRGRKNNHYRISLGVRVVAEMLGRLSRAVLRHHVQWRGKQRLGEVDAGEPRDSCSCRRVMRRPQRQHLRPSRRGSADHARRIRHRVYRLMPLRGV